MGSLIAVLASADTSVTIVQVDSDEGECDEANNEVEIPGPFCTGS